MKSFGNFFFHRQLTGERTPRTLRSRRNSPLQYCDNQVISFIDTRLSVKSMCLLWYLCIVQIIKSIVVISIEYRSLSAD
jgi:hypothetical protein